MHPHISLKIGDITKEKVCAIVNAANSTLMGGGGVDGAIHQAGGSEILQACQEIRKKQYPDGLPAGEAVATTAGAMRADYVIHTVGPIYNRCGDNCATQLASCYTNSLKVARKLRCKDIAFPAISTGIYGYPKEAAAQIAYEAVEHFLKTEKMNVLFVFYHEEDKNIFQKSIRQY